MNKFDRMIKQITDEMDLRHNAPAINIPPIPNIIGDKEEKIGYLVKELKQRDGQYKELLEENERLERELKWANENLTENLIELSRYRKLVDGLMKTISLLITRTEGNE